MIKMFDTQNWRLITDFICATPVYQVNFPFSEGTVYYVLRLCTEGGDGMNKLYFWAWIIYVSNLFQVFHSDNFS